MTEALDPSGSRGIPGQLGFPVLLEEPRCRAKNGIPLLEEGIPFFYRDQCR
jgi:hypothetical protein